MKFLKVTNRGTIYRKLLELIGFSTKRDRLNDARIIGSKGSGTKISIPAVLRLGLDLWICSSDEGGSYFVTYKTRDVKVSAGKTVKQIFMVYDNGTEVPLQFLLESFADWDKPLGADTIREFKIVREILANAQDADPHFTIEVVEDTDEEFAVPQPGETTVFVSLTEGIEEIVFKNPERYFKFLTKSEPLFSVSGIGEVFPRSGDSPRVFLQGVLIECLPKTTSGIFDYSLFDKKLLSEERTPRDSTVLRRQLAELILSVESRQFAKIVIHAIEDGKAVFESIVLNYLGENLSESAKWIWPRAWEELHGEKTIISSSDPLLDGDAQVRGYTVHPVSSTGLKNALLRAGVKQSSDFVSREPPKEIEMVSLAANEQAIFDRVYALLLHFCPLAQEYPVRFFESRDEKSHWEGVAGLGETRGKEIWLSRAVFKKGLRNVLEVLIHELRHCVSKAQDYTPDFERQADKDEAELMLKFGPPELLD